MLNVFPDLLAFGLAAPLILRVVAGFTFVWFGYSKLFKTRAESAAFYTNAGMKPGILYVWVLGAIELVAGVMLVLGFLTQIAALALFLITLGALCLKKKHPEGIKSSAGFLFLLAVIAFTLILSGAGFYAFDLPL